MQTTGINRSGIAAILIVILAGALGAQAGNAPESAPLVVEGRSNDHTSIANAIDARIEDAMDAATAAALIGALERRFAGRDLALRMGDVQAERASLRDILLHGNAQIRLGRDVAWLPIRFEALYDTDTQAVSTPSITLVGMRVSSTTINALPLPGLQAQVMEAMAREFASQRVDVSLQRAQVVGNDGRRLVVRARGIARFDGSDTAPVTVRALYEQGSGRWVDTQYDFDVMAVAPSA